MILKSFLNYTSGLLNYISRRVIKRTYYLPLITLTYRCNFSCHYCLVRGLEEKFPSYMSIENFYKIIKWFKKQKIKTIQLWGGEPTIHPQFPEILDICKQENMKVILCTNNFFNDSIMGKLSNDYIKMVIIDYFPPFYKNPNYRQYLKNLNNLQKKHIKFYFACRIAAELDYDDLVGKLKRYKTFAEGRTILPGFSGPDISIKKLKEDSRSILKFLEAMDKEGLKFFLRGPVLRCAFSDDEWRYLKKYHEGKSRCYPGAYNPYDKFRMGYSALIAINPDLSIFPCAGVFFKSPNILLFKNIKDLDNFLKKTFWEKWRWSIPLMKECESCRYFLNKECQGGCLNHKYYKLYKNRIVDISKSP